jgi:hypothetical protein
MAGKPTLIVMGFVERGGAYECHLVTKTPTSEGFLVFTHGKLVLGVCGGGLPTLRSGNSYLVDPASSHMLVSKIKPCMSKYKHLYCETANGSLNQL